MDYPLSSVDIERLRKAERARGRFVGVCSYDSLPYLHNGQFCISNTDNIYPLRDPAEGGHHWLTVCCIGTHVLVFYRFGRALVKIDEAYTELQPHKYFLEAFPERVMVMNTFAVQSRATAVCECHAVQAGRLFIEEGSVEGLLKRLRGMCGEDTLANDQKVLNLVPLTTCEAVKATLTDLQPKGIL